jgi:hypothetical protein
MGAATMRHTVKTSPGNPARRVMWRRRLVARASCGWRSILLEMSENLFHTRRWTCLMGGSVVAGVSICQNHEIYRAKAPTRLQRSRLALMPEAATYDDWHLARHVCHQMSTGSASRRRELAIKKTRACLLRSSRLGEKTFTRHPPCTLRLHLSCIGERGITLNNGAADANGR